VKQSKRTLTVKVRVDETTKKALHAAADNAGMSVSALALMAIKELLLEGETKVILPPHLRISRTEDQLRRERLKAYLAKVLRERKQEQRIARQLHKQRKQRG
jgi:antitoxin component of RelBE/YafQ-DinJ toxin-antitoxin module